MKNLILAVSLFITCVNFGQAQCDTCAYIICSDYLLLDPRCDDRSPPLITNVTVTLNNGNTMNLNSQFGFSFPYSMEPVKEDDFAGLRELADDLTSWLGSAGHAEFGFDFPGLTLPPCRTGGFLVIYSRTLVFDAIELRSARSFCTGTSPFSVDCESPAQTCSYRLVTPEICGKEDALISLNNVWICGGDGPISLQTEPGFRFPYQYQYGSFDLTYRGLKRFRNHLNQWFKAHPAYDGTAKIYMSTDDPGVAWLVIKSTNAEFLKSEITSSEAGCSQSGVFDVSSCQ